MTHPILGPTLQSQKCSPQRWVTSGGFFTSFLIHLPIYKDVCKSYGCQPQNSGKTPKSSILIGFSIINHPFWGTIIFGNTHMQKNFCELPQFPKTSKETSFYSANDSEKENIPCFVVFGHAITNSNNALAEGKSFKMTIQMRYQGKRWKKETNKHDTNRLC